MDDLRCPSGASGLSECSTSREPYSDNCADSETVGIECSRTIRNVDVRIRGGASRGVLEMNIDSRGWRAVCDDGFGRAETTAVCRQLGYASGTSYRTSHRDRNFAMDDDLRCPSGASGLSECSMLRRHRAQNSVPQYSETVGIECSGSEPDALTTTAADCTLASCAPSYDHYTSGGSCVRCHDFAEDPAVITGSCTTCTDTTPLSCSEATCAAGYGEYRHYYLAPSGSVPMDASNASVLMNGVLRNVAVRIRGGASTWGVLEMNIDSRGWRAVCGDRFGRAETTAVCRQLGYASGTSYRTSHGDSDFAMDDLRCPSGASGLSECSTSREPYSDNCADSETVGIECADPSPGLSATCRRCPDLADEASVLTGSCTSCPSSACAAATCADGYDSFDAYHGRCTETRITDSGRIDQSAGYGANLELSWVLTCSDPSLVPVITFPVFDVAKDDSVDVYQKLYTPHTFRGGACATDYTYAVVASLRGMGVGQYESEDLSRVVGHETSTLTLNFTTGYLQRHGGFVADFFCQPPAEVANGEEKSVVALGPTLTVTAGTCTASSVMVAHYSSMDRIAIRPASCVSAPLLERDPDRDPFVAVADGPDECTIVVSGAPTANGTHATQDYIRLDAASCDTEYLMVEYTSESEARLMCDHSPACTGYQDRACDGSGTFVTCSPPVLRGRNWFVYSAPSTCMYIKASLTVSSYGIATHGGGTRDTLVINDNNDSPYTATRSPRPDRLFLNSELLDRTLLTVGSTIHWSALTRWSSSDEVSELMLCIDGSPWWVE
jgi:hypothetical protein